MRVRSERGSAIAVGVLYIAATVAGVLSQVVSGTSLAGPGISADLATNEPRVIAVAFFLLVMAVTVSGVAVMMYPILMQDADTKVKEGLSIWYVGTRIAEGTLFVVALLGLFALLALSKAFVTLGVAGDHAWMLGLSVFCVGAVMLYYLLYESKRVPRWLSVWGLIAAPLMLVAGFSLVVTGDPNSTFSSILYAPLGLQEMALAVWLLVRGFNPPTGAKARLEAMR
jgi:hypothetical protein